MAERYVDATIAIHDALRSRLPELAALAAAAPFHAGRDSGLASVRPAISRLLPRQGVPPALHSPEHFAAQLARRRSGSHARARALAVGAEAASGPRHA